MPHHRQKKPPATPAPVQATPSQSTTSAIPISKFLATMGVNTHFNFGMADKSNAYANVAAIEAHLTYLGIKNCRDTMALIGGQHPAAVMQAVNKVTGAKFCVIVWGDTAQEINDIKANTGILAAIEGPNEIDNWPVNYGGLTGQPAAAALQKHLYADVKPLGFPVFSLSIADASKITSAIKSMDASCDYFNTHIYTMWGGNGPLSSAIIWSINSDRPLAVSKPPVCTEFGWWTKPGNQGVTEAVQAKYLLTFFFEAYLAGIFQSYYYELIDEKPDAGGNSEMHYGLFRNDGTPKAAATALSKLTNVLRDAGIPLVGYLSFTLSNPNIRKLLMRRSDGDFVLALWQDQCLWDNGAHQEIAVPPVPVTITFGDPVKYISTFDPLSSVVLQATNPKTFQMNIPDHPVLLWITV